MAETISVDGDNVSDCTAHAVDHGSIESHRLYLARKTVFEMLKDRGYVVPDSELTRSLSDFRAQFTQKPDLEHLRICAPLAVDPSSKVLVIFCGTEEIRKKDMVGILSQITSREGLNRVILILQNKMNSHARKVADEYPVKVEIFQATDLLVNITKHFLAPKYEILSTEEKQKLLKKFMMEDGQMPRMLVDDPVAKYHGLEKGQVMKVTYKGDGATGYLVTYRCVM